MKVFLSLEAFEQALALPAPIRARVWNVLRRLREWPAVSGARRLSGGLAGHYRIRTGDYRVQFAIEGDRINIVKIGHRDGFYDE